MWVHRLAAIGVVLLSVLLVACGEGGDGGGGGPAY
jgi:hypothetical protein